MVESKLRVEVTRFDNGNTHYYGNVVTKKVIEDVRLCEFDKRDENCIAPFGIVTTIAIDKSYKDLNGNKINAKEVFEIKVNRYYFDHEGSGGYLAFFSIEEKVYELFVNFEGKHITNITLSEWLQSGYFEDGDDADNVYEAKDFTTIEVIES